MGSLSNDDGNGSENVTQKVNLCCFKLHLSYSSSFNLWNVGDFFFFFRNWILKDCDLVHKKKKKVIVLSVHVLHKREIRKFHIVIVQWRQRNVQKSVMHVQNCCFASLNLLLLYRSRCRRRRRWLSSLMLAIARCALISPHRASFY